MTPIVAMSMGLSIMASSGFGASSTQPQTFNASHRPATPNYSAPRPPQPPKPPTMPQGQMFKPYKPTSVYSPRGGIDSYPAPKKPRSYIDLR
jgi:hypothetical protein